MFLVFAGVLQSFFLKFNAQNPAMHGTMLFLAMNAVVWLIVLFIEVGHNVSGMIDSGNGPKLLNTKLHFTWDEKFRDDSFSNMWRSYNAEGGPRILYGGFQ